MVTTEFEWKNEQNLNGLELYANGRLVGKIEPFVHDAIAARDELSEVEPGLFAWVRHFKAAAPVENARLTLDFTVPKGLTYGLIPSVSYNGNPWGPGHDVKGFSFEGATLGPLPITEWQLQPPLMPKTRNGRRLCLPKKGSEVRAPW